MTENDKISIKNKKPAELKSLSFFDRYLSAWVILCIIAGVAIGKFVPLFPATLSRFEYAHVSIPVAVLIWLMIYPMMLKIDFASIVNATKKPKGLAALTLGHKNSLDKIANAKKIVVIDGCPVKCASQIVSKFTDKKPDLDIQIMEKYGIEKIPEPTFKKEDVGRIVRDIEEKTKAL